MVKTNKCFNCSKKRSLELNNLCRECNKKLGIKICPQCKEIRLVEVDFPNNKGLCFNCVD